MKTLIALLAVLLITGCGIDYSCKTDNDCAIMNVGNKCGYYPQCVNQNFEPNPPELKSSVCGFPEIDYCECIKGRCTGKTVGSAAND